MGKSESPSKKIKTRLKNKANTLINKKLIPLKQKGQQRQG